MLGLFKGVWGTIVNSIEVFDMVSKGVEIEKRGRRSFNKQTAGVDTNLKNRVSQKEYVHSLGLFYSLSSL